jgi:hypothetical protein
MKSKFESPKILTFLMLIFLISTGVSCKDQKNQKSQKVRIEDDESFADSNRSDEICQLLTKDDIRSVFELDDQMKIYQEKQKSNKECYYRWKPSKKRITYFVSLNFVSGDRRTSSEIDKVWKIQSNFTKKHNPRAVSGVGEKASWSDLYGGRLSVIAKGYVLNIFISVRPEKDSPLGDQDRIDKAKALAKQVIERI